MVKQQNTYKVLKTYTSVVEQATCLHIHEKIKRAMLTAVLSFSAIASGYFVKQSARTTTYLKPSAVSGNDIRSIPTCWKATFGTVTRCSALAFPSASWE